jgi:hypothetical protein
VVTKDDTRLKNSHGIQILELSYTRRDDYCFEHERYKARVYVQAVKYRGMHVKSRVRNEQVKARVKAST